MHRISWQKYFVMFWLLIINTYGFGQVTKIMGQVKDSLSGEPLPFVNIVYKGTTIGVMTDFNGKFSLETKTPSDSLVASFIGYKQELRKVDKGKFQYINFSMLPDNILLETVVIRPGENPAEILLRKIIAHKDQNDPDQYDAYQYDAYTKIEIDLNNVSEKMKKRKVYKHFSFIFDNVDTSTVNGKTYLPIFLSEALSEVYSKRSPKENIEIIKATKISGVDNSSTMQFLGDKFQHTNIYSNYVELFTRNFVSPIANFGLSYYKYYLVDSAFIDKYWCYNVMFKPRHKQTLTFTGNFWVNDSSFAIKKIEMRIVDDANINYINDYVIRKEFDLIDGKYWLLTRDYAVGDFNPIEENKTILGFFGKKTSTYRNFIINQPKSDDFYRVPVNVLVDDSAGIHSDDYWKKNRHETFSRNEQTIYYMIDTLRTIPRFNTYLDIAEMIATGYYVKGKMEYGPYASLISFNAIEGVRLRFGARTSNKFSNKIMLEGYGAYGSQDNKFKYGGSLLYMFDKNPRRSFSASFKYDLEQLGSSQNAFREDFFLTFLFRRNPADKLTLVEEIKTNYEHEWFNGFSNKLGFNHRNLYPMGHAKFEILAKDDGILVIREEAAITTSEISFETRFAYKEQFLIGEFQRISLGTKYPVLSLNYSYGVPNLLDSDFEYHRLQLNLSYRHNVFTMGWFKLNVEAGRIWGTVPYPLLKLHEGNETFYFDESSFNLMNYYEFASDKYLSISLAHHFGGYFFNKVPLLRKLKWREVVYVKGLIGGMDLKNQQYSVFPDGMHTLDRPYFEAGTGVDNIFKIIRIDAIWRLSYLDHQNVSSFGVMFSLQFAF